MRTLTTELIAAQQSESAVPYVQVVVRDRLWRHTESAHGVGIFEPKGRPRVVE